jgi:RHS repeat-associated protein
MERSIDRTITDEPSSSASTQPEQLRRYSNTPPFQTRSAQMAYTQPTLRCAYRYDPLDQLINQTQPDMPALQRFYCKSRLTTEIQGATHHSIFQHGDQLLAQQSHDKSLNTTLLATDLQRSVLETLDTNGRRQPYAYSPYGHRPSASGLLSLLGFNGERPDLLTGHYLLGNGYRAFNPVLMRFNSPDSLSPFGKGGINAYVYCGSDPRNRVDTTGHNWVKKFLSTINDIYPKKISENRKLFNFFKKEIDIDEYQRIAPELSKTPEVMALDSAFIHEQLKMHQYTTLLSELSKAPKTPSNSFQMEMIARKIDTHTNIAAKLVDISAKFNHPAPMKQYVTIMGIRNKAVSVLKDRIDPDDYFYFDEKNPLSVVHQIRGTPLR